LPEPSSTFLAGLREDTPQTWHRLVEWYAPIVARWCRRAGLRRPDSEDILQDVFLAIRQGIGRFRRAPGVGSFHAWAATIARRKILDHFRRQDNGTLAVGGSSAHERLNQLPDASGECSSVVDPAADDALLVRRALDLVRPHFAETTWKAFWAVVVDGREAADVAADLGLTPNAVRVAKSKVLRRLREEAGELLAPADTGPPAR
jgi:RNA polymerase sigma-70 factor (ECF subfamily)